MRKVVAYKKYLVTLKMASTYFLQAVINTETTEVKLIKAQNLSNNSELKTGVDVKENQWKMVLTLGSFLLQPNN